MISLAKIVLGSRANGPGLRDVFWTAGCMIGCEGCINPLFLDRAHGIAVPLREVEEMLTFRRDTIEGITFSGGEPTEQAEAVASLGRFAHSLGLSVVLFTGRTLVFARQIASLTDLAEWADIVIAGPYVAGQREDHAPLLGSRNQTIHFLTGRYSEENLRDIPDAEIRINGARISVSGLYTRVL